MKCKRIIAIALAGAMSTTGCWSMRQQRMINTLNNRPDLQLCMVDNGIDPNQVKACIMNSDNMTQVMACNHSLGQEGNGKGAYRCFLQAQSDVNARLQARSVSVTSVTVCTHHDVFGGCW